MRLSLISSALFALSFVPLHAGSDLKSEKDVVAVSTPFDKGRLELQSASGVMISVGPFGPALDYYSTAYRLGLMLNTPEGDGFFRGNFEVLLEAFVGSVFDGPGSALGGGALLLRYNFVPAESKWTYFFQLGGGGLTNDIYKDHSQRLIGTQGEFDLEAAIGVQYFFSDRWSGNIEADFRHISNAGINERNVGLNSVGGSVGLGYHF